MYSNIVQYNRHGKFGLCGKFSLWHFLFVGTQHCNRRLIFLSLINHLGIVEIEIVKKKIVNLNLNMFYKTVRFLTTFLAKTISMATGNFLN